MATHVRTMRRGLPRQHGGDPWPPEGLAPIVMPEGSPLEPSADNVTVNVDTVLNGPEVPTTAMTGVARSGRRGLPRFRGGDAWPPASEIQAGGNSVPVARIEVGDEAATARSSSALAPESPQTNGSPVLLPGYALNSAPAPLGQMRRGLPRVRGGDRWPTRTVVIQSGSAAPSELSLPPEREGSPLVPPDEKVKARPGRLRPDSSVQATAAAGPARGVVGKPAAATSDMPSAGRTPDAQNPARSAVGPQKRKGSDPRPVGSSQAGASGRRRAAAWAIGGMGLFVAAVGAVFCTRWLITLGFMQEFLVTYPGEIHLPASAKPGFPVWVQWQHFFNVFLMVLIVRTGLQVRAEKRPSAFWTPRWSKGDKGKISLNLWLHQSLDALWLLNGVAFVVLLFVTDHWMRLVPTTWDVFPNALSALIQYLSLDWPTENGWVNYNSLQMLMYFLTVFIAAPLAALTGVRMSGVWPSEAKTLNRLYSVEWARAIHFPVMLYFISFIVVHVALVFATGALRNLNHMYGGQDVVNWAGFWIFFASLVLIVGVWLAARPFVLAPIAGLFGRVSSR